MFFQQIIIDIWYRGYQNQIFYNLGWPRILDSGATERLFEKDVERKIPAV